MSNYKEWLGKDVQPEHPTAKLTGAAYWKNWWHYHWAIVLGVIVGGVLLVQLIATMLGVGQVEPDYQIGYVGSTELPEQTVEALTNAIAALGQDENGDGQVVVKLNQYIATNNDTDVNAAMEQYAASVQLTADLSDAQSYFWLLEDPDAFQQENMALALPDGSCPADDDTTGMDKVYRWADCPVLASQELGSHEELILGETFTGENQALLQDLYLGRRCFYSEDSSTSQYREDCAALWATLTEGTTR